MKIIQLDNRTQDPAYFDMGDQHPPGTGLLRIGDRAAAYIFCLEWRLKNPHRKLIVLDVPNIPHPAIEPALPLTAQWMFNNIADEIWVTNGPSEPMPKPPGQPLYNSLLWVYWKELAARGTWRLKPTILPETSGFNRIKGFLPRDFIVIHPLFNAQYNIGRNIPVEIWNETIQRLALHYSVVITGDQSCKGIIETPHNAVALWDYNVDVMEALAVINKANLFIGGETGLTIWSAILRTPTLSLMKTQALHPEPLTEPLSFGGHVIIQRKDNYSVEEIFSSAKSFLDDYVQ